MKNSDNTNCCKNTMNHLGSRITLTVALMLTAMTFSFAQDFTFIEGSVHSFKVDQHEGNTFEWTFNDLSFDPMPSNTFDFIEGQYDVDVTIQFNDMSRVAAEMVYLAVTEARVPSGCSTTRAIKILLEPNNMYLDFASIPNADDCYNFDENYYAEVNVGMNFTDRDGVSDAAIDSSRFPLKVKYTVENKTLSPGVVNEGNGGNWIVLDYSASNAYTLEVSEAKGAIDETIEYELAITDVVDNYGTAITHDQNRRVQIRIMNHLPQSNSMDMAMAYVVTPFSN